MMVYCNTQPEKISLGREKTIWKSSCLMVRPMPNIAVPKKSAVYWGIHLKPSGCTKAIALVTTIITAKYLDRKALTWLKKANTPVSFFIFNFLLTCMLSLAIVTLLAA